jgi:DNA-binding transcriptional MerR regulator
MEVTMQNIIRIHDVAKMAGVTTNTILNHERVGNLPPAERLGVQRIYTPEAARQVVIYFAGRKKWSRMDNTQENDSD